MPNRSAREIRQDMIALLTETHGQGEPPPGKRLNLSWATARTQWTAPEIAEAFGFVTVMFLLFAWDAEAANAKGRPPDVTAFLQRHAMLVAGRAPEEPLSDGR
jgi:hypothetical protein